MGFGGVLGFEGFEGLAWVNVESRTEYCVKYSTVLYCTVQYIMNLNVNLNVSDIKLNYLFNLTCWKQGIFIYIILFYFILGHDVRGLIIFSLTSVVVPFIFISNLGYFITWNKEPVLLKAEKINK